MSLKDKTIEFLSSMDSLGSLTMSPSIFSGDYDCDECPAFDKNAGDLYDEDVCRACWKQAILDSEDD